MKTRHVFSTPDLVGAAAALAAARAAGVEENGLLLVARSDIELDAIPDRHKEADTDMMPAALRGAGYGGATGLLAGLVAVAVPPLGITLAGAAAIGAMGAMIGAWSSAMVGASLPDPIRRKFEDEIKAGRILVVIDAEKPVLDAAEAAVLRTGATPLPWESTSALA